MAHMVKQIIKYSDGTETVIDYRGQIVNGVLIEDGEKTMSEEVQEEVAAPVETPAEAVEEAAEVEEEAEAEE